MATFTVKVNTNDLPKVLANSTDAIRTYLEQKLERIVERLATEVAQPIAQQEFGSDVVVTTNKRDGGYEIVAEGEQVCFLEFGAGVATDNGHPFASKTPFIVRAGSWSEGHSQQFSRLGFWIHDGVLYREIQPRRGMYEAYKAILQNINMITEDELGL